jgi:hypothetical protein
VGEGFYRDLQHSCAVSDWALRTGFDGVAGFGSWNDNQVLVLLGPPKERAGLIATGYAWGKVT